VEIVRAADGEPVRGQWEPILPVAEWDAVVALIGANPVPGRGANTRHYLLTGTLRCGRDECGARLRAQKTDQGRTRKTGAFQYICPGRAEGGCARTSIAGTVVDRLVSEAVIAKYEMEAARRDAGTEAEPWHGEDRLNRVRNDLREMTAAWRAGNISAARYFALLPELETEECDLAADRERWIAATRTSAAPASIRADWHDYPLAQQRAYIEEALAAVVVAPAASRGRHNQDTIAARLTPVWRTPA
jgi:hypothetical protein